MRAVLSKIAVADPEVVDILYHPEVTGVVLGAMPTSFVKMMRHQSKDPKQQTLSVPPKGIQSKPVGGSSQMSAASTSGSFRYSSGLRGRSGGYQSSQGSTAAGNRQSQNLQVSRFESDERDESNVEVPSPEKLNDAYFQLRSKHPVDLKPFQLSLKRADPVSPGVRERDESNVEELSPGKEKNLRINYQGFSIQPRFVPQSDGDANSLHQYRSNIDLLSSSSPTNRKQNVSFLHGQGYPKFSDSSLENSLILQRSSDLLKSNNAASHDTNEEEEKKSDYSNEEEEKKSDYSDGVYFRLNGQVHQVQKGDDDDMYVWEDDGLMQHSLDNYMIQSITSGSKDLNNFENFWNHFAKEFKHSPSTRVTKQEAEDLWLNCLVSQRKYNDARIFVGKLKNVHDQEKNRLLEKIKKLQNQSLQ